MPKEFTRSERVSGQLRRELAQLIQQEIKNPRVGFISVSDVEVSRDLAHAKVFVTVFDPDQVADTIKGLKSAAGFLRRRLGQELRMRVVPELHFQHDPSVETGQRMDSLIASARASDADREAHPSGEPDQDDPEASDAG